MRAIQTYEDADQFLVDLIRSGIKLGLENTRRLLAAVDNPHHGQRYIHVAGTNGKGSVCAMLATALTGAGYRVGMSTSPHLVNVRERFRVDGEAMDQATFIELVRELATRAQHLFDPETNVQTPTYFEFLTVLSLLYFRRMDCEYTVIEVGMGGRLDSTNVIDPALSIITTIDFDHMNALGNTLALIAGEKGGIIKPGVPVICGEPREEPLTRLQEIATLQGAPITVLGTDFDGVQARLYCDAAGPLQTNRVRAGKTESVLTTRLTGPHQLNNCAVAHAALVELKRQNPALDLARAVAALPTLVWPGRLQTMPDGVIIDASHNHAGLTALMRTLAEVWPEQRFTFLFGALNAKPWREMLRMLTEVAETIHIVGVPHSRAGNPVEQLEWLKAECPERCGELMATPAEGLAVLQKAGNGMVVGSLYLAGAVLSVYSNGEPFPILAEMPATTPAAP